MDVNVDLTTVWAFIIAFAVFAYVVLDGFDLGIGILFPTITVGHGRNRAMNSIAPVWDGNETWLVLGGGGLMAAFPLAYAVILPPLSRWLSPCCSGWCSAASRSSSAGATRRTGRCGTGRSSADRWWRRFRRG